MSQYFGFFVASYEYERGWGSKFDGYVIFEDDVKAQAFINKDLAGRHKDHVPDYYIDYRKDGWNPISEIEYKSMKANGLVHR